MKKVFLVLCAAAGFTLILSAQTARYFEFITGCGHGNWRDSSFIVKASNQALIDTVLAELTKPKNSRRFVSGPLAFGNGGFNHNASHWFLWHIVPDQWNLAENAIEVCDGCPYSDLDADVNTWVNTVGAFCPWTGKLSREVPAPVTSNIPEQTQATASLGIYPNPTSAYLCLKGHRPKQSQAILYNGLGRQVFQAELDSPTMTFDVSGCAAGVYSLKIYSTDYTETRKVVIQR